MSALLIPWTARIFRSTALLISDPPLYRHLRRDPQRPSRDSRLAILRMLWGVGGGINHQAYRSLAQELYANIALISSKCVCSFACTCPRFYDTSIVELRHDMYLLTSEFCKEAQRSTFNSY